MLAANGVDVIIAADDGYVPTPVLSHAILAHNRDASARRADGVVITPSHNPPEDGGYNRSRSWAHMYWGGALFCFLADVEIRTRTRGEKSLADALRAVQRAGGTITSSWAPQALIETADGATGVPVLAELWSALAEGKAPEVELSRVLADLGVRRHADGGIWLDEAAPRAWVRRAITGSNERPR